MPVTIRNETNNLWPLPYPLKGFLGPGKGITLAATLAQLVAVIPGIESALKCQDVPGYGGATDDAYDAGVAAAAQIASQAFVAAAVAGGTGGVYNCASGLAVRTLVYEDAAGHAAAADSTSAATMPCIGVVTDKPTTTTCTVKPVAEVTGFVGLTTDTVYYVGAGGSAGLPVTSPGAVAQRVGVAKGTTAMSVDVGVALDDPGHSHGGTTGTAGTGAVTGSTAGAATGLALGKIRRQEHFAPPASANIVAQYPGGAPLNDGTGPFTQQCPPRTVAIVLGAGGVATVYTITGTRLGAAVTDTINAGAGAGTYQGAQAFDVVTRVTSDVDPVGTTDVKTGSGVGLGDAFTDLDLVGIDGDAASPASSDAATGTVVFGTAPNGTHRYAVRYRTAAPAITDGTHTHAAGGLAGPSHAHSVAADFAAIVET